MREAEPFGHTSYSSMRDPLALRLGAQLKDGFRWVNGVLTTAVPRTNAYPDPDSGGYSFV